MGAWGQDGLTNNPSCPHAPEFNRHGALAGRGRRLVPNLFRNLVVLLFTRGIRRLARGRVPHQDATT